MRNAAKKLMVRALNPKDNKEETLLKTRLLNSHVRPQQRICCSGTAKVPSINAVRVIKKCDYIKLPLPFPLGGNLPSSADMSDQP